MHVFHWKKNILEPIFNRKHNFQTKLQFAYLILLIQQVLCLAINIKNKPRSFVKGRFLSYGTKTLVNSVTLVNKIKTKPGRIA